MTDVDAAAAPPEEAPPDTAGPRRGRVRRFIRRFEWVIIIATAVITALLVKTFLLEAFYIPSESMEPALEKNDRVLVEKLSYRVRDIHRGDIVVFERPPTAQGASSIKDFIKRVIALPNETIETRDGRVYINGKPLNEPYLTRGAGTGAAIPPTKVREDHYWVMGDNRSHSSDSRIFGQIDGSLIIGRAFVQVWPLSSLEFL